MEESVKSKFKQCTSAKNLGEFKDSSNGGSKVNTNGTRVSNVKDNVIKVPLKFELSEKTISNKILTNNFTTKTSDKKLGGKLFEKEDQTSNPSNTTSNVSTNTSSSTKKVLTIPLKTKDSFDPKKGVITTNKYSPRGLNLKDLEKPALLFGNNISPRGFKITEKEKSPIESIKLMTKLSATSKSPTLGTKQIKDFNGKISPKYEYKK